MARRGLGGGVIALIVIDIILVVVLVVLLVTHPTTPGEEQEPQESPTAAEAETTPPPEESPQTPDLDLALPEDAAEVDSFAMPSRNIWCELEDAEALCYIGYYTYSPPADESCEGEVGPVVRLTGDGATFPCVSEENQGLAPDELPALDYNEHAVSGDFWCSSSESGVTCRSTDTGRGFTLAVGGFTPF